MKLGKIIKIPRGGGKLSALFAALAFASPLFGEDAYIESDGTQYINLGHFIGPNTKIEFDFAMAETPTDNNSRPLGARGGQNCRMYFGGNDGEHRFSFWIASTASSSGQGWNSPVHGDTARHTAVIDYGREVGKCTVSIDLSSNPSKNYKTFGDVPATTATQPLIVFAENSASACIYSAPSDKGYYMPAKVKVYGITISESGVEVKKFVPCVKGGVAGLKETHSGLFHTTENQLQHPLAYGGDILVEKDDPYVYTPRNTTAVVNDLSTFLDTGYTVTPTTRVELDYAMMTPDRDGNNLYSADPYIIGALGSQFMVLTANGSSGKAGTMSYRLGSAAETDISSYPIATAYNVRRTAVVDSNSVRIVTADYTNLTVTVSAANAIKTDLGRYSLKIGASYTGVTRYLPMKVYRLRIYESGDLVKDYVPFVSSGVGGLTNRLDSTDKLTSKTRLSGDRFSTGVYSNVVFDVGGDIACADAEKEAYLEFTGVNKNSLNTGYVVTKDTCIEMDYSIWNTKYNGQQFIFEQADRARETTTNDGDGIWARAYYGSTFQLSYSLCDYVKGGHFKSTGVTMNNARTQLKLDSYNNVVSVYNDGKKKYEKKLNDGYSYSRTKTTCATNLWIGGNWSGLGDAASMRLYSFKLSETNVLQRCYVPYKSGNEVGLYDTVTGQKLPLPGGKVSGATFKGQAFQISPAPAKLEKGDAPATLKCLAAGAQSYEWHVDGVKIDGETSDTLQVEWIGRSPHTRTYSVVPVYTVFNETVKGGPAEAQVEFTPDGMIVIVN